MHDKPILSFSSQQNTPHYSPISNSLCKTTIMVLSRAEIQALPGTQTVINICRSFLNLSTLEKQTQFLKDQGIKNANVQDVISAVKNCVDVLTNDEPSTLMNKTFKIAVTGLTISLVNFVIHNATSNNIEKLKKVMKLVIQRADQDANQRDNSGSSSNRN